MKGQLDGIYPFERAELFYKEIKKLGVFEDGYNFLDKFRILITNVGNALGIIRLLRTATLNFCSKSIEYLPNNTEFEFHNYTNLIGFSGKIVAIIKVNDRFNYISCRRFR